MREPRGSVYIDVGDEFGILNTSTGVVTPIFTGVSPHGADFVSFGQAVPEPSTVSLTFAGALLFGVLLMVKLLLHKQTLRGPVT